MQNIMCVHCNTENLKMMITIENGILKMEMNHKKETHIERKKLAISTYYSTIVKSIYLSVLIKNLYYLMRILRKRAKAHAQ